jgi:hypothetical protein
VTKAGNPEIKRVTYLLQICITFSEKHRQQMAFCKDVLWVHEETRALCKVSSLSDG